MLRLTDLTFERGDDVLFSGLDGVVYPGQRMAVVGRNGIGKSTLFKLVLGELESSRGSIEFPEDWRVGYMAQEVEANERPALDYVIDGDRELRRVEDQIAETEDPEKLANLYSLYEDLGGYQAMAKAGEILNGLGFDDQVVHEPYASFSGGWRIRLNLAQALMCPSDLLLLDEPTNHLDLEAILWLEGWLNRFPGAMLIIAHDRAFLDSTATSVMHLAGNGGKLYKGNYSAFEHQRAAELERQQAMAAKHQAQVQHIQQFVDRFRAKASKAKQVQSRIKALERMQTQAALHVDSDYRVNFSNPEKVSNPLFSFRDLVLGYEDNKVLHQVSQTILPGARIGVLGANGAGKSTLLKALVGDLRPLAGTMEKGQHAEIGYFAQHQLESLDTRNSAYETFIEIHPAMTPQQCRDYLGGWGFSLQMIERPISSLSGGEKARLVLSLLAAEQPAILVLDEPTNHLDLDMRDALALALQAYSGAVIIVAHDRNLLEKIVDEFWLIEDGSLKTYRGDLDDYTESRQQQAALTTPTSKNAVNSRKRQRQERAAVRKSEQDLRKTIKQLERDIEQGAAALKSLEATLADKDTYAQMPADDLNALLAEAAAARKNIETLEEAWLAVSSKLEAELT
ncbi:MAG TPA: ABC transporter ATP-binding protein [Gammaproteobacteria bacterium]|jgi:ATP-binding cassette subfamily F protein 3|nr:ABC transporter ATP-binding protein [Gammaproteobacteria bacterium]